MGVPPVGTVLSEGIAAGLAAAYFAANFAFAGFVLRSYLGLRRELQSIRFSMESVKTLKAAYTDLGEELAPIDLGDESPA